MRWWILLLLLLVTPLVAADNDSLQITLDERGKVTNYLSTYWVVTVEGDLTIQNPSESDLYDIRLDFDLLGLQILQTGGSGDLRSDYVYFDSIAAESEETFSYQIIGIAVQPPTITGGGVFYSALVREDPRIYSDGFGRLMKTEPEDSSITGRNARLVTASFENPTELEYTIQEMRVIKTPRLDPNEQLNSWTIIDENNPYVVPGGGVFYEDILDRNATEGEVYWLQSDVFVSGIELIDNNELLRITEENLTAPVEELNFTNATTNETLLRATPRYLLRKDISTQFVTPGEPMTVSLRLYNFEPQLSEFSLSDSLPAGFSADQDLSWTGEVPTRDFVEIQYDATLESGALAGIDQFPAAEADIQGVVVRSQPISFIRGFTSDNRLYVQKSVDYVDDSYSRITISVRNLGADPVQDITIRELIDEQADFSEITRQPESRGVWRIPQVMPGDEWRVSYTTLNGAWVENLPSVFGVPSDSVLRTLLLQNIIREGWEFSRTRFVELFGIGMLLGVPILIVLSRRFGWFAR